MRHYRTGVIACVYRNFSSAWRSQCPLPPLKAARRRRAIGVGATATPLLLAAVATATPPPLVTATTATRPAPMATTGPHLPTTAGTATTAALGAGAVTA